MFLYIGQCVLSRIKDVLIVDRYFMFFGEQELNLHACRCLFSLRRIHTCDHSHVRNITACLQCALGYVLVENDPSSFRVRVFLFGTSVHTGIICSNI